MKKVTCEICGLKTGRIGNKKRMFMAQFPLDEDRCRQWVKVTGKEDLAYVPIEKLHQLKHICEKHFRPKDFKKKKTQIKRNAIPSIGITADPLSDEILSEFPLHIVKDAVDERLSTRVLKEHNYYCNINRTNPSTSILEIAVNNLKRELSCSPNPSTSSLETVPINLERKRSCSPKPSTSTLETAPINLKRKRSCSPKPSTSKQKNKRDTPTKKMLRKELKKTKITIKSLKKKINQINKLKSPILKSFVSDSVKNQNLKSQGIHWTKLNKSIALAIYKKSPKAYKYIKQLLPLPNVRTLQTILQNIQMDPGVYPAVISHLKKEQEEMSENNKICVVMFNEIALKKRLIYNNDSDKIEGYVDIGDEGGRTQDIADHALVFMLQGICQNFKQPIAHYFVKGTISTQKLAVIIQKVIQVVRDAGYCVIATVCDQSLTNVGALKLLKRFCGNPVNSNYFLANNEKVFIIYDVPHLFKSIRNNFLHAGTLVMENKKAEWSHLIQLEEINRSTLHFTKITKLHIQPKYPAKMRVKLAAELLSNTVAAILKLLSQSVCNVENSQEILETAEIIEDLDILFDCTNGPSSHRDIKNNIRENVRKNTFHHRLWIEFKKKLESLHFLKSHSRLRLNKRCVNGYIITITSLQDIWKYVESKNFKYLNLRQLNKDSLENLFEIIRQHSPKNKNPTCHHFQSALKSSVLTRLIPRDRLTYCESDDNEILFDFHDLVFQKKNTIENKSVNEVPLVPATPIKENLSTSYEDLPLLHIIDSSEETESDKQLEELFKMFDKQPTVYVSGYLAKVILKDQNCQECCQTLKVSNPEHNSIYDYIALREWWSDKSSLTYPTIQLCKTVDLAVEVFEREVRTQLFRKNISEYCVTLMMTSCDMSWMCKDHRSAMSELLLRRLSHLLIRNDCRNINHSLALTEEKSKKAQQL